jgi:hypothetical protein
MKPLALAALALFSFCPIAHAAATTQPVAEIHSIDELERQLLVHLTNGDEFRFAVQRAAPEFGDAWIIYCLQTKGAIDPPHDTGERELALGSLRVSWEPADQNFAKIKEDRQDAARPVPPAPALTCWMIDPMAGRDVVHFRIGNIEVARAELAVDPHHISAWRQFSDDDFGDAQRPADAPWLVVNDPGAAVLPKVLEQQPLDPRAASLPTTQPSEGLKLGLAANEFDVDAGQKTMDDDQSLIARWWVNGKPCIPRADAPMHFQRAEDRLEQAVSTLRVRFSLPDDLLALHPGARLAVQVMYCPDGWQYADSQEAMELIAQKRKRLSDRAGILVSNRLDFLLTQQMLDDAKKLVKQQHRPTP